MTTHPSVPCLDPATVGFDTPLAEYLHVAADAGFELVEVPLPWLTEAAYATSREEVDTLFDVAGVLPAQFTCAMGVPANLAVPYDAFAQRLRRLPELVGWTDALGCTHASFYFDTTRNGGTPVTDYDVIDRIAAVADVLGPRGVRVSIGFVDEPLLRRASAAVERAARPGVGILVDVFCLVRAGFSPKWVEQLPIGSIEWLRVADARSDLPSSSLRYEDRLFPGAGDMPLADYVRACRGRGYEGPVSVEVGDPRLASLSKVERARQALAAVQELC